MKVCPTNALQPVFSAKALASMWTPELAADIGYCEYNCNLCGKVCPTGAIEKLSVDKKKNFIIAEAKIDRTICLPWAENKECIVCEEHCPVSDKAIKIDEAIIDGKKILRPVVDKSLCIGCGICQNKCPARPIRAIRVTSIYF